MTDKMAILGEGDSVLAFKASGVDAYYASDREQAKDILRVCLLMNINLKTAVVVA